MPNHITAAPIAPPQGYFHFTPSALVLSQETKLHRQSVEPVRRPRLASERTIWHRTTHTYERHVEPATAAETGFRHGGWAETRSRVRASLVRCSLPTARIDNFDQCGSGCHIQRNGEHDRFRLAANYCHDRFCLPCARARSKRIAEKLRELVGEDPAAHLVLTLKHSDDPLDKQLDRLIRCFAVVRRLQLWTRSVKGGAYFFEVKVAKDGKRFHPHLHVIISGSYIDQALLSEAWLKATGDSNYVYIKAVDCNQRVLSYAAKYASKSYDATVARSDTHLDECVLALRGRRLCSTFGTWRGVELEGECDDVGGWVSVGRLDKVIREAMSGSVGARSLLLMVAPKYYVRQFGEPGVPIERGRAAASYPPRHAGARDGESETL